MTVAEYIEELNKLDQDKGIWVAYDFPCAMFAPKVDCEAEKIHVELYGNIGVKEGDYVINVW